MSAASEAERTMSTRAERPDELNRLLTVSEAIESLGAIFAAEEPLDDVLSRVAHTAASAIPGADAISITAFSTSGPRTPAGVWARHQRVSALAAFHIWTV